MIRIADALEQAKSHCDAFDAQLLLAYTLGVDRSYLFTWPERSITSEQADAYAALLTRRANGEPVAYLTGVQAFWSLEFQVNQHTLIPRAETELLVETALAYVNQPDAQVLDLGTGSGAIAIALAHEKPQWQVTAIDKSPEALVVAKENARLNDCTQITFIENDWLSGLTLAPFDCIIANPPYIADNDPHLAADVRAFEPRSALIAADNGLADLETIIQQSKAFLKPGGFLLLEHGFQQASSVQLLLEKQGYQAIESKEDLAGHARMSAGQIPKID